MDVCSGQRTAVTQIHSHKDTKQRELWLVRLQEVDQEADRPREAFKQAADAGHWVGACLELLGEEELCKPCGGEREEQRMESDILNE